MKKKIKSILCEIEQVARQLARQANLLLRRVYFALKMSGRILRNLFLLFAIEFRQNRKFRKITLISLATVVVLTLAVWNVPTWYEQYIFRTRWPVSQENLKAVLAGNISSDAQKSCEERRKETDQLYAASDIQDAINKTSDGKIVLVGKQESAENSGSNSDADPLDSPAIVIDASGKDVALFCFDFNDRVVVQNAKNLEIGFSHFQNISGNALTMADGNGEIHDNLIENSQGSGIFVNGGNWEISKNVIQKNSSYGIYGGYGADLNIHENAISDNKGYQVRVMKTREVYK